MGSRKYIYWAFFLLFAGMYLRVHLRNENYSYRWPLGGNNTFAIVSYGNEVSPSDITYVRHLVESVYDVKSEVVPRDPAELTRFFNSDRRQYNIDQLLDHLEGDTSLQQYFRALVVVHKDIYGEGSNFVFGTGDNPGRLAVITTKGYGYDHIIRKKIMRVLVVHEIGHTLSLVHCQNKCAMVMGNNVIEEAKKFDEYCMDCEKRLERNATKL